MTLEFDATKLGGTDLVVFEYVYTNDNEDDKDETLVVSHEDIYDEDQFANIVSLDTTAKDKKDGDKELEATKDAAIIDVVDYCLKPDQEYILKGILMDKNTNKPVLVDGKEVTSELTFRPYKACGSIEMEFYFDASKLGGTNVVVFESVYLPSDKDDCKEDDKEDDKEDGEEGEEGEEDAEICEEDQLVIAHEDINDDAQLIRIYAPETPNTGLMTAKADGGAANNPTIIIAIVTTSIVILGAAGSRIIARRKMLR